MMGPRQPPVKPPAPEQQLSASAAILPAPASGNGSGVIPDGLPPALVGVTLSTPNTTVRRKVLEAYWRDEIDGLRLLPTNAWPLVVGLLDTIERRRKLARARDALEARLRRQAPAEARPLVVLKPDFQTREVEKAIADKDTLILSQLRELGWTPTSAARLGLNTVRGMDLASEMSKRDRT